MDKRYQSPKELTTFKDSQKYPSISLILILTGLNTFLRQRRLIFQVAL